MEKSKIKESIKIALKEVGIELAILIGKKIMEVGENQRKS